MSFRVGFNAEIGKEKETGQSFAGEGRSISPRKSLVQVFFESRGMTLSYYNDLFDLRVGDLVYVDGKLEGLRGRVVDVSYSFRIRVSDYKRVIALADTDVSGTFNIAGSHFVTFDRAALPRVKAASWFMPPSEEEVVSGDGDGDTFMLDDLTGMGITQAAAERGRNYYAENKVRYLCLEDSRGYAIVEGSRAYEVEFEYRGAEIRNLVCSCFCGGRCKHEYAVMLQLRDTLRYILGKYAQEYEDSGYFAAVPKETLYSFAIDGKEYGSITL